MELQTTPIDGLLLLRPRVFEDDRGAFSETWNQQVFDEATGEAVRFVQANESVSKAGVLRGLHFQAPPHAQGKLVRVVRGRVLDVAVDLRSEVPPTDSITRRCSRGKTGGNSTCLRDLPMDSWRWKTTQCFSTCVPHCTIEIQNRR